MERKEIDAIEVILDMFVNKLVVRQGHKDLYSAQDLAERYGVSASSMRARIRQGEFGDVVKVGDHALVKYESMLKYEAEHTGPAYKPQQRKTRRGHLAGEI